MPLSAKGKIIMVPPILQIQAWVSILLVAGARGQLGGKPTRPIDPSGLKSVSFLADVWHFPDGRAVDGLIHGETIAVVVSLPNRVSARNIRPVTVERDRNGKAFTVFFGERDQLVCDGETVVLSDSHHVAAPLRSKAPRTVAELAEHHSRIYSSNLSNWLGLDVLFGGQYLQSFTPVKQTVVEGRRAYQYVREFDEGRDRFRWELYVSTDSRLPVCFREYLREADGKWKEVIRTIYSQWATNPVLSDGIFTTLPSQIAPDKDYPRAYAHRTQG
jgi:hypothetical protein